MVMDTDTIVSKTISFLIIMHRTYARPRMVGKNQVSQLVFPEYHWTNRNGLVLQKICASWIATRSLWHWMKLSALEIFILCIGWYLFGFFFVFVLGVKSCFSLSFPLRWLALFHSFSKFLHKIRAQNRWHDRLVYVDSHLLFIYKRVTIRRSCLFFDSEVYVKQQIASGETRQDFETFDQTYLKR